MRRSRALAAFLSLLTLAQATSAQQPDAPPTSNPLLTSEALQQQIEGLKQADNLPEETRTAAIQIYESAAKDLARRAERRRTTAANRTILENAPRELEEIDRKLRAFPAEPEPVAANVDLEQLRGQQATLSAEIARVQKALDEITSRIERRPRQMAEIPALIDGLTKRVAELRDQASQPPSAEAPEIANARQVLAETKLELAQAELDAAESERQVLQNAANLFAKRREYESRRLALLQASAADIESAINKREENRQRELAKRALLAAASEDPRIQDIIAQNRLIASDYNNTDAFNKRLQLVEKRVEEAHALLERIESDHDRTRRRLQLAGSNAVVSSMMRASRKSLPDPRLWHRRVSWIGEAANETALRKIEIDEALQNLDDIPARVNEILGKVDGVKTRERLAHESLLGEHLQTQRDLLRAAADAFDRMLNGLSEYDARSRELIQEVEEFDAFIAERILWVESTNSLGKTDAPLLVGGAIDLIDPSRWLLAWDVVSKDFFKAFAFYATLIGAAVLSIVVRPRIRRLMRQMGEQVTKDYVGTPHLTLLALAGTIVMAGLVPLGLYLLGQHILASTAKFEVLSLGTSLQTTAAVLFSIGFVRQCCRPSGLAITHFRWRASSVAVLRRNLQWLAVILIPLFFATAILRYDVESPARTATVRVLFIAQMLSLAFFLYRTLHHSHAVAENLMGATASGWMKRLRVVWYPTAVLLPVSLGLFAGLGYLDSSLLLNDRLLATLSLAVGVVVVNAVLLRWLYAVRGQLALEQTRKRREAEQAAGSDHPAPAEAGIDLSLVNVQTRRMLSTGVGVAMLVGLLFIWSDIIPALRALERFAFWSKTEFVWETQTDADTGTTRLVRVEETTPVTLATFASVILMGFVAVAAARNVPGFLEVTLLARLPLDAGARFAISTVARYVISIAGLLICSNHLGIRWDSVQWLAAGFTVGLGFGLQEIVANFVSGLILLVERPIRIGDVVTVGDLHGSVSRIQMRATTITDWDRKELVVPNKEFITSKFINWTLSDRVLRLSFSVGIEYGEDTHRATQVLLDIARRQPHILADPPPSAFFESFGDSSLNLRLIAFVDNVDYALKIKHEMNTAINEAFTREKIGMAFPQRDVNVRFVPDADTLPKALSDLIAKDTPRRASA